LENPVGVFDSGVGGLTVLRELVSSLPAERFVYLGSTTQVFVRLASGDAVQALVTNAGEVEDHDVGSRVSAHLAPEALRVLPGEVGEG